jgi:lysine 2,3-aminomutase
MVPSEADIDRMTKYISARSYIREVIISGGDPLCLSIEKLDRMLRSFRKISNIQVLRLGTRVPVVLPMRITHELVTMLKTHRPMWINTHFNHPKEITDQSAAACDRLLTAGIPVSNHTVLLRGVNNRFDILRTLFTELNRIMVRPYYLFHCDAARGTDHFRTSIEAGIRIMHKLWGETGGLCIPRYVVDLPLGGGKAPVMPSFLLHSEGDIAIFRTSEGKIMEYRGALGAEIAGA